MLLITDRAYGIIHMPQTKAESLTISCIKVNGTLEAMKKAIIGMCIFVGLTFSIPALVLIFLSLIIITVTIMTKLSGIGDLLILAGAFTWFVGSTIMIFSDKPLLHLDGFIISLGIVFLSFGTIIVRKGTNIQKEN